MIDKLDTTERRISIQSDDGKRHYEIQVVENDEAAFWSVKRRDGMRFQKFESGVSGSMPEAVKRARRAIERAESRIGSDDV